MNIKFPCAKKAKPWLKSCMCGWVKNVSLRCHYLNLCDIHEFGGTHDENNKSMNSFVNAEVLNNSPINNYQLKQPWQGTIVKMCYLSKFQKSNYCVEKPYLL